MQQAGYSKDEADIIRQEVEHFSKVRDEIKIASGDVVDMKQFEPAMRQMLDLYIEADPSETLMDFEELGLIELIVQKGAEALDGLPKDMKNNPDAMAEAIENNVRKAIVDENPVNPKYYEQMSVLLDELIQQRRQQQRQHQFDQAEAALAAACRSAGENHKRLLVSRRCSPEPPARESSQVI